MQFLLIITKRTADGWTKVGRAYATRAEAEAMGNGLLASDPSFTFYTVKTVR
jgi:hypothetical protein